MTRDIASSSSPSTQREVSPRRPALRTLLATTPIAGLALGAALAAPPAEVGNDHFVGNATIAWNAVAGASDYNVYRGSLATITSGVPPACHGDEIVGTSFSTPAAPPPGQGYFYVVTAESNTDGEGTPGNDSHGVRRPLLGSCDRVMRNHLLGRVGYGWDEWSRDRLAALGRQAYIAEQLNPASIDESTNTELSTRLPTLVPPGDINELIVLDVVNAVYARRQLEQQATMFWDNHFDTDYKETNAFFGFYQNCSATRTLQGAKFHYDAQNAFRDLAFNGTFREILEASALGPAMIVFLDTDSNLKTAPNENFSRELLELHTQGVDGGYTQQDIVELARVFTGWNVCKKTDANAGDPLAACLSITPSTYCTGSEPVGQWVTNFRTNQHDNGQKILFQGTAQQTIIPSTPNNSPNGINDAQLALDAIVAHPSTPKFIAQKLLQRYVTETPTQTMIDNVVAEWNDGTNPHGIGDLREVLRAVLAQAEFTSPDQVAGKIKTPFEQVASVLRAARGKTNETSSKVRDYLQRMSEILHQNGVPTGYSELGADWLDTNNLLERQNFALDLCSRSSGVAFNNDIAGLLAANGVSTAQGNAPAIVDFFADVLFGGALTPAERQAAISYLSTDDSGVPGNYTAGRIRETFSFLMGYAQFLEQ